MALVGLLMEILSVALGLRALAVRRLAFVAQMKSIVAVAASLGLAMTQQILQDHLAMSGLILAFGPVQIRSFTASRPVSTFCRP